MTISKPLLFTGILAALASVLLSFSIAFAQELPQQAVEHRPVCTVGNPDTPRCHARVVTDKGGKPQATTSPTGLSPQQILSAYGLNATVSANRTIAIVDAYDHPYIASDLATFSSQFGIQNLSNCPVSSGTPAHPCFQKVDQRGGTVYPAANAGWALEIALDVEAAHGLCQNCNILLVEADSNSYANLMAAVDRAYAMGAHAISNSYGSKEFSGETTYDFHFNHPGVAITFSSGDDGFGVSYPAASRFVTAVGGTTLMMSGNTYMDENAWSGSGSGCSLYEPKPIWQASLGGGCSRRIVADVSAVADPATGLSVYNSYPYSGQTGWFQVGGTSLSAPVIAAVYALGTIGPTVQANSIPYSSRIYGTNMRDVVGGKNGNGGLCRRYPYFCNGVTGFDGPTGLGTPLGVGAF